MVDYWQRKRETRMKTGMAIMRRDQYLTRSVFTKFVAEVRSEIRESELENRQVS